MKLRILREAEDEARASAIWYDEQLPGLGDDFLDQLSKAMKQIENDPDRFPMLETIVSPKQIRRVRLSRFPYLVIFEILKNETVVLAIAHAKRHPNYWRKQE